MPFKDPEKGRLNSAKWLQKPGNREKHRAAVKKCRDANKAEYIAKAKAWKAANPDKVRAYKKAGYERNKEKVNSACRAWYHSNKEKVQKNNKEWRAANKEHKRDTRFLYSYKLSRGGYAELFAAQNGLCAVCLQPQKEGKRLCVDHNHTTGKVRALLCSPCNVAVGHFEEDCSVIKAAIEYAGRQHPLLPVYEKATWRRKHAALYQRMLTDQNHSCYICKKARKLFLDHNHATGHVRALLCSGCNSGLGWTNESPEVMQALIGYLEKHS